MPYNAPKTIAGVLSGRKKTFKRLIAAGLFALVFYMYGFGDYGMHQFYQLRQEEKRLRAELVQLQAEAKQLEIEKQLLETRNPEYVIRIAREKFGLVKPGEKIFKLTPVTTNH